MVNAPQATKLMCSVVCKTDTQYARMDEIACDLMNAVSSDDLGSRSSSALYRNQAILAQASQGVSASVIFVDENENG